MTTFDAWASMCELLSRLGELAGGISQKMLTQTLMQMERDGFSLCGPFIR